jgi:hypothetical protein
MAAPDLADELRRHMAESFPELVQKGEDYGEVDPVMIGADIYGWALELAGEARSRNSIALDSSKPPKS